MGSCLSTPSQADASVGVTAVHSEERSCAGNNPAAADAAKRLPNNGSGSDRVVISQFSSSTGDGGPGTDFGQEHDAAEAAETLHACTHVMSEVRDIGNPHQFRTPHCTATNHRIHCSHARAAVLRFPIGRRTRQVHAPISDC